jgi:hypothetical protein
MLANDDYVPAGGGGLSTDAPLKIARMEEELRDSLQRAAEEIAHAECLDEEQRAEVYTILDALRDDGQTHRRVVGAWVSDKPRGLA